MGGFPSNEMLFVMSVCQTVFETVLQTACRTVPVRQGAARSPVLTGVGVAEITLRKNAGFYVP